MNFLDIRAGEPIEIGTQTAYRFWRYVLPHEGPARLLSWVFNRWWRPDRVMEGPSPDVHDAVGIHGFRTMADLEQSYSHQSDHLVMRATASGRDGVVIGTVELWGVVWEHDKGYRAQYARPTSFIACHGQHSERALQELRASFFASEQARIGEP